MCAVDPIKDSHKIIWFDVGQSKLCSLIVKYRFVGLLVVPFNRESSSFVTILIREDAIRRGICYMRHRDLIDRLPTATGVVILCFFPDNLLCQEGIMSTPFNTKVFGCTGDDRCLSKILQSQDNLLAVFIDMRLSHINFVDISFHSFIHFYLHAAHQNRLSFTGKQGILLFA